MEIERIARSFCQIILKIIKPVAVVITGSDTAFNSYLFVGIVEVTVKADFTVGRSSSIRIESR